MSRTFAAALTVLGGLSFALSACSSDDSGPPAAAGADAASAEEGDAATSADAVEDAAEEASDSAGEAESSTPVEPEDLSSLLEPIRESSGVPALGAWVADVDAVVARGVVGERKAGDPTPATVADKWHIGSDTKAMTATIAAMLVEEGALRWDMTLAEALPELASGMNAQSASVTVEQLLLMQAGFNDASESYATLPDIPGFDGMTVAQQRRALAEQVLALPPDSPPGTGHLYSNLSYILVGAVMEAQTSSSWEELMNERVFEPLGMDACGFGPPATPGQVDQPWGHERSGSTLVPVAPGPYADNPAYLGPAGTVHCSLESWSRFASVHLRGALGASDFLAPSSFEKLHTPGPGPDAYAMGWGALPLNQGLLLTHDGSNTLNYARVMLFTDPPLLLLIVTNEGSEDHAVVAVDEVTNALLERYGADWSLR